MCMMGLWVTGAEVLAVEKRLGGPVMESDLTLEGRGSN